MHIKKLVSGLIVLSVVGLLIYLGLHVNISSASKANSVAIIKSAGMTCSSCSNRISRALGGVKGVAVTEVDVEGGVVIVGYDRESVQPENLAHRISGAGYASNLDRVLTPEQFRRITGRDINARAVQASGCCGIKNGGCNSKNETKARRL
ncbi:MAG: hypothetical protein A2X82_03645 [Geobacteraceae bacterium GWC2_55_20]|nr:MAG: hypothetical protein A2X82_03645 [Geobacteraceae bacterium GWC2_55_20]HBA71068.1 copper chaperone [Geobacter sp.]HCE68267.1 copper chaperone [Geobacter sp.]